VTDDEVCAAIDEGATTVEAVGDATRAGTGCGGCQDYIEDLLCERCPLAQLQVA